MRQSEIKSSYHSIKYSSSQADQTNIHSGFNGVTVEIRDLLKTTAREKVSRTLRSSQRLAGSKLFVYGHFCCRLGLSKEELGGIMPKNSQQKNRAQMSETTDPWDRFVEVEQSLGLAQWEHQGIKVWKLLRFSLWREYLRRFEGKPSVKYIRKPEYKKIFYYGLNVLIANPFLMFQKKKRIVIASGREVLTNGIPTDPTTSRALSGALESENLVLFTSPGSWAHYKVGQKSNLLPNELGILISRFLGFGRTPVDTTLVETIIDELFGTIADEDTRRSLSLKLAKRVKREERRFRGLSLSYGLLFSLLKPKYLYLVVSYGREAAIYAAKERGIQTIEFQHGFAGRGHPGYDFPGWKEVPYFPDQFLSWGPSWLKNTRFPANSSIHYVGSSYISDLAEKARLRTRPEKTLLVLSQGKSSLTLINCAIDFARLRPDWKVTIKLHPKEKLVDFQSMELGKKVGAVGISLATGALYDLFSEHDVVLGANSTALVEAAYAGCKVAVFRSNYKDFSKELCDNDVGAEVKNATDLADVVENINPSTNADIYFSSPSNEIRFLIEG